MSDSPAKKPSATPPSQTLSCIDMHVHIVGDGSSGSGCWLNPKGLQRYLAHVMVHQLGLPRTVLQQGLDTAYVQCLQSFIDSSSLSHVVILAHDHVRETDGTVIESFGSFYVPNDYVLELADANPSMLPAVSIHPARPDAIDELERCVERGAVLMKCLPNCQNIDCSKEQYRNFWKRMADLGLPLLAHTGGEHTVPQIAPDLSDPGILREPLEQGVTVIAAHCGTRSGISDPDYFPRFCEMLTRHANLYGDLSGLVLPIRAEYLRRCRDSGISDRLLHGSDFPVPCQPLWLFLRSHISRAQYRELSSISNPLERDLRVKQSLGFEDAVYSRAASILKL